MFRALLGVGVIPNIATKSLFRDKEGAWIATRRHGSIASEFVAYLGTSRNCECSSLAESSNISDTACGTRFLVPGYGRHTLYFPPSHLCL